MNFKFSTSIFVILFFLGFSSLWGQDNSIGLEKKKNKFHNWHNLDIKKNKTVGISTDRAYKELLKSKKATTVIVAVIDGGVDINHEDLKDKIWTNTKEIPGNGIDDDHNGYIDDIHGWNFIGGSDGQNINKENTELTRIYRLYSKKYEGKDSLTLTDAEKTEFKEYKTIKSDFLKKYNEAKEDYNNFLPFKLAYHYADSIMQAYFGKKDYTVKELKKFKPGNDENLINCKDMLIRSSKKGFSRSELEEYAQYLDSKYLYQFNTTFNPRGIVGDDPSVMSAVPYGNNDVIGPDAEHGTFVSGIIAADRNNNLGLKGIADSVKIMVIRAVPDGDEYDKDVANAIIYAVNNGAKIINCSFGKSYSPQKHFVDEALKLAAEKDVLIVHAAGNDAENNDSITHYPDNYYANGAVIDENWITVGATSQKANSDLVASFSNYGEKTVDLFAPGYRIYSSLPNNKYGILDGTSFSAPMVAGAAALLKSYYPWLTAKQLKDILCQSGVKYPDLQVYPPSELGLKTNGSRIKFSNLSQTGSILNVYNAIEITEKYYLQ
jgi:subtilisin family serine protease